MIVLRTVLFAWTLMLVTGCGNLQALKIAVPPETVAGRPMELAEHPASNIAIAPNAFRIGEGTFISQSAGGSAVPVLMFGLVGVLMNNMSVAAESERVRNAVSPSSAARIRPAVELAAAWKDAGFAQAGNQSSMKVESFVIFYLDTDRSNVYVVPGLRVTGPGLKVQDGSSDWVGHYLFVVEKTLPPQRMNEPLGTEELAEYGSRIRAAYRELLNEVASDLSGGPAPRRKLANINAPALKATVMGFAGFTGGDIDQTPDGRLAMRVSIDNYGPAMSRANPYFVWVFPSKKQYTFEMGPEERQRQPPR